MEGIILDKYTSAYKTTNMIKRTALYFLVTAICITATAQSQERIENIIIVTTDGFRWQEVFKGMDSAIANNKRFNQGDSAIIFKQYWARDAEERRMKLLPFLWGTLAKQGQVYGNRLYDNKVDNANPYWFSYPGYNEIFTGFPDTAVNSNEYKANPNTNLLEFIVKQPGYKNKVAAFGAWEAFDRILNKQRCGFPVVSAFDTCGGAHPTQDEKLINAMLRDSYKPFGDGECLDVFTHYEAKSYLKNKSPKVLYISYGETDEWAHAGRYKDYLNAANQVDKWLGELWTYLQSNPQYKNKTALFITVDHGRGDLDKSQWTSHGTKIPDAHEIWFAVLAPGIAAKGEMREGMQLYQKQFAQTIASLMGLTFEAEHPIGEAISTILKK